MNKHIKYYILFILIIFVCNNLFSQNSSGLDAKGEPYRTGASNLLNSKNPEDIGIRTDAQKDADEQKPLKYSIVDDKDILWSKMVWEIIDLDERINFPLLYPLEFDIVGKERRPMLWWLRQEIEKGTLDVYDPGFDEAEFLEKVPPDDLNTIFKIMKISDGGRERLGNAKQEIRSIITDQVDYLGGINPYEGEVPEEVKAKMLDTITPFKKIFPYRIKKWSEYNLLTSREFTYEMFQGYINVDEFGVPGEPVRIMQPDGYADPLSEEEIIEYGSVLEEILIEMFFVEKTDFTYNPLKYEDIKQWKIKGLWYFDKKYAELIYRPIGIAPVAPPLTAEDDDDDVVLDWAGNYTPPPVEGRDTDNDGIGDNEEESYGTSIDNPDSDGDGFNDGDEVNIWYTSPSDKDAKPLPEDITQWNTDPSIGKKKKSLVPVFWVYYPHAREVLKKGKAFNNRNSAVSKSFDDIIISRRFNAVIYKEENVFENRNIKDYIPNAFMRLLESERIKEKIRNFEHDMWSW